MMISQAVYLNWLLALPFFAALCAFLFPRLSLRPHSEAEAEALPRAPFALGALACVFGISLSASLLITALRGEGAAADYWWTRSAYEMRFRADSLTALAVVGLYVLGLLLLLHDYSLPTPTVPHHRAALLLCVIGFVAATLLSADLITIVFFVQLAALSAWLLLRLDAAQAADRLLFACVFGSLLLLAGALLLWRLASGTATVALSLILLGAPPPVLQDTSVLFLLGVTPLLLAAPGFTWLFAAAHARPRLGLGLALPIGLLGLYLTLRLLPASMLISQIPAVTGLGLTLGLLTLWWGVALLWNARSLHRAAAALVAAQAGQFLVALSAAASPTALPGALQATPFHLFVAPLALLAVWSALGVLLARAGTDALAAASGLWRALPLAGLAFLLGGLSIGGLPPLPGFWPQRLVVLSLLHEHRYGLIFLLVLADVLIIVSVLNVFRQAFLREAPPALQPARRWQQPQLALSLLIVVAAAALTGPLSAWSTLVAAQILTLTPR